MQTWGFGQACDASDMEIHLGQVFGASCDFRVSRVCQALLQEGPILDTQRHRTVRVGRDRNNNLVHGHGTFY